MILTFGIPLAVIAIVYAAMIWMNERYALFAADHFRSTAAKVGAYIWLGLLLFVLTVEIVGSALRTLTPKELAHIPFYTLFGLHAILLIFLIGWWLLAGRPRIADFLNLRTADAGEMVMTGFAVGVGGWIFTLILAAMIVAIAAASGLIPATPKPSPMIGWMATLPLWKRGMIVLSAMTVEEAFFRGWLQKRVGLLASTLLFAVAHSGLGQPVLLVGVFIISLIIGVTFYRTKNLLPGIIAHGVFDGVQLFVIIPVVYKAMGMGG